MRYRFARAKVQKKVFRKVELENAFKYSLYPVSNT